MTWTIAKIFIAAGWISGVSWLAGKRPQLAGFLTALPLTTLIALALNHLEYRDSELSSQFAKSIFLAVPITLAFFVPFLLAPKTNQPFWLNYSLGIGLLTLAYFVHRHFFTN